MKNIENVLIYFIFTYLHYIIVKIYVYKHILIIKTTNYFRYNDQPVIPKKVYKAVEAYDNRVECQTIEDLMNIKDNNEALHYESLIIRY